jgi:hypothetical protein
VASVLDNSIRDVAIAGYAPDGAPIIRYNTFVLSSLEPQTRLFFYGHECAHHKLAHAARNIPFSQEQEADCWSIRELVRAALFGDGDIAAGQRTWRTSGPVTGRICRGHGGPSICAPA